MSAAGRREAPDDTRVAAGTRRVVIVDDDATIRKLLRTILARDARYEVVAEAADGAEAIAEVARVQPEVVLLDLMMPRLSGREALPALRDASPDSMVLVVSALSTVDEREASLEAGAFDYLEKSVMGPRLPDVLDEHLERFRGPRRGDD